MPEEDPRQGDVYMASKKTSVSGDKHGNNARPVGVVERLPNVAVCLGRTTHPDKGASTIPSNKNSSIPGLTKDAHWQDRHQRPVARRFWGTPDFKYVGLLPDKEKAELLAFWQRIDMLGRRNL